MYLFGEVVDELSVDETRDAMANDLLASEERGERRGGE
jgi:hypothetical protein